MVVAILTAVGGHQQAIAMLMAVAIMAYAPHTVALPLLQCNRFTPEDFAPAIIPAQC